MPSAWKKTKLVVIFKKGDPKLPSNYRPIAIIPILYKLFSRMLCDKITPYIMQHQDVDQAAYRTNYSTEDHLLTTALLIEKSNEYNFPLWFALVDFEKAFDSVEHAALWDVLEKQSVPAQYVDLIKSLYEGQTASVQAGVRSREFAIERGVKQGDPISALLFIAVMQAILGGLQTKWKQANARRTGVKFGVPLAEHANLTNLRFADDVILAAQSKNDVRKMLTQFADAASHYGLRLHFGKTKIMTWDSLAAGCTSIRVGQNEVSILREDEAEKYLGRKLCFRSLKEVELQNRLSAGWAAFHKHKGELCSKFYRTCDRVKLFEAIVSPTVLYGSAAWAQTRAMEDKLRVTRRKMLRCLSSTPEKHRIRIRGLR